MENKSKEIRTAVSVGCGYKIEGSTVSPDYPDIFDLELTDGTYAPKSTTAYNNPKFVGLAGSGFVTVDLGKIRDDIIAFEFSFLSINDAGIMPPAQITVTISDDGLSWASLGKMALNAEPVYSTDKAMLEVSAPVTARYVRFEYTERSAWVFADEVAVYANTAAEETLDVTGIIKKACESDISDSERRSNINKVKSGVIPDTAKAPVSLSNGMSYTVDSADYPFEAMKDDGKKLTDGNKGTAFEDGSWVAFDGSKQQVITLDLGSVQDDISGFSLTAYLKVTGKIYLPSFVDFAVSTDGSSFYSVSRLYPPTVGGEYVYSFDYKPDFCISARYVRYTVGASGGKYTLVSELTASAYRGDARNFYPPVVLDTEDVGPWQNPTDEITNLILGKQVQIEPYLNLQMTVDRRSNTPASSPLLTDGKNAQSTYCYDGTWFHCFCAIGRYFYFDLGHASALKYVTCGVLHDSALAIYAPKTRVYISEDGVNWYVAGSYDPVRLEGRQREEYNIVFDKAYMARFVCFDIEVTCHAFLDELCAFGCKSLDGAASLGDSSLERFEKPVVVSSMEYQSPSESLLHGVNDVVLAYYNNMKLDEEYFRPYVGYIVDGRAKDTMFDGFLFLPNPGKLKNGGQPDFRSDMEEWADLEDKLFIEGQNLDALNKAAAKVKNELGLTDYKYKFFVSVAHPSKFVTDFGDIDGDGRSESLATVEGRLNAVKWYVERFYSIYKPENYENLEFAGWYWFHESIDLNDEDPEVIKAVSDYLHTIGDQLCWIPYYAAEGYTIWKDVGFDVCCMQPNYAFSEKVGDNRLKAAADIIRLFNMCIEIEADGRALSEDIFFKKYLGYLSGGIANAYMKEAIHMYYEAAGMIGKACHTPGRGRVIYDSTYKFIKKTLTGTSKTPEPVSLKCDMNGSLCHKITDEEFVIVTVTQMPSHGTVTVNGDGTVTYYPGKDFVGTDSFRLATYDYIELSKEGEITVKVGK